MSAFDSSWLDETHLKKWPFSKVVFEESGYIEETLKQEIGRIGDRYITDDKTLTFALTDRNELVEDGFITISVVDGVRIEALNPEGLLYGYYHLYQASLRGEDYHFDINNPTNKIRMINHWDNVDGSIERGYAGSSIFFRNDMIAYSKERVEQYARMLASTGINAISINNVNVHHVESYFITQKFLNEIKALSDIFNFYGIKLYLSINYASPIEIGGSDTSDPLDEGVIAFWQDRFKEIYEIIPNFGGIVVKADSENRPGPHTYGRSHSQGANMLAAAIAPYGGLVFWRCFVYDNHQDWRDRTTDRAKAAYDIYKPMDGEFADNVVLQIKNGPMDFQIREATSPLFGALRQTNQALELQITQEYTGQQWHVCYLAPMWKEIFDFNTFAEETSCTIQESLLKYTKSNHHRGAVAAVVNIGDDYNWTGHKLAQVNLYAYGRLTWASHQLSEDIASDWVKQTFTLPADKEAILLDILLTSRETYEMYTSPLGIGWMVKPNHHYGPDVNGYEYDLWGTYHFSDRNGLGVDRTVATGTGYSRQYSDSLFEMYENLETCPEELLLFFHHLPYSYQLKSGKSIIQHIYSTHFEGYERVVAYSENWKTFKDLVPDQDFINIQQRLVEQLRSAREWRDQINTYYYRMSGVSDEKNRIIYP